MADGVSWENVHSQTTKADFCGFLKALDVWIEKPHVVNRRLMGALIIKETSFEHLTGKDLDGFFVDQKKHLLEGTFTGTTECDASKHLESGEEFCLDEGETDRLENHEQRHLSESVEHRDQDSIILRKLLPRQLDKRDAIFELVILEKKERRFSFFPLSTRVLKNDKKQSCQDLLLKSESYSLLYETSGKEIAARVSLQLMDNTVSNDGERDGVLCPTVQWLQDHLLPKLCKWAEEIQPDAKTSKGSLRLVPLDQYTLLYHRLKQDYGERLVKIWPERTDPQKFVYEDIAIASYLLILWEEERKSLNLKHKQRFADLGCGNGLLVHILNEEGHPGTGVDVRRRKIWDSYGGNTNLQVDLHLKSSKVCIITRSPPASLLLKGQERALDPTQACLFPDVDWLIGNHSDELTPWIPVMAARSSYTTRYFVLPCCLFDFNRKFIRRNNKVSQYRGYLDFVHEVGETCGFQVEEDSMRIPSTKRICQIGRVRTYPEENQHLRDTIIKEMILKRGCDVDAGNIPETLASSTIKRNFCHDICRTSVEDKDLLGPPCKTLHQVDKPLFHENHERNSAEIHGPKHQQNVVTTAVDVSGLYNHGESFSTQTPVTNFSQVSSAAFQPRPSKEPMRNCTSLDRSLKDFIVNTVAQKLLGLPLKSDDSASPGTSSGVDKSQPVSSCTSSWRKGVGMRLSEVAKLFDKSTLLQLKNECGGLQTLLRNHYYVFKVTGGVVEIRDWTQEIPGPRGKKGDPARKKRRSEALWKTSLCWFHLHHPDGCPVSVEQCPFAHGEDELKERPTAEYLGSL